VTGGSKGGCGVNVSWEKGSNSRISGRDGVNVKPGLSFAAVEVGGNEREAKPQSCFRTVRGRVRSV
jgi:hypothetical protein